MPEGPTPDGYLDLPAHNAWICLTDLSRLPLLSAAEEHAQRRSWELECLPQTVLEIPLVPEVDQIGVIDVKDERGGSTPGWLTKKIFNRLPHFEGGEWRSSALRTMRLSSPVGRRLKRASWTASAVGMTVCTRRPVSADMKMIGT